MKITRYFIASEDHDSGIRGFIPLWIAGGSTFNPGGPSLMVHDMLEHRLCDQGHFHEELMAFGRVIALRIATFFSGPNNEAPSANGLGTEIGGVWGQAMDSGSLQIAHAPKTKPITGHDRVEDIIQEIATKAMQTGHSELGHWNADSGMPKPSARLHAAMVGWMRVGYMDAVRRYGGADHGCYDVGHSAFGWAYQSKVVRQIDTLADEHAEDQSMVLRLSYDTKQHRMSMREIPLPEHGHAAWLRRRIGRWHTGHIRSIEIPTFTDA